MGKKITVMSLILIICIAGFGSSVKAADGNYYIDNTSESTFGWAVPEGGYSSLAYRIIYRESYNHLGTANEFVRRDRIYGYTAAGATEFPYIILGSIKHYNASGSQVSEFTSFEAYSGITDTKYKITGGDKNTEYKVIYPTVNYTGKLSFMGYCPNAIVPVQSGSVSLSFNVN